MQGSLFDEEYERLYHVLEEIRTSLDDRFPEYSGCSFISLIRDDGRMYLQPSTDYNVIVLVRGVETSELERIAREIPGRFERAGLVYTVHVEDEDEHVETQLKAREF